LRRQQEAQQRKLEKEQLEENLRLGRPPHTDPSKFNEVYYKEDGAKHTKPKPFTFHLDQRQRSKPLLYIDINLGPGRMGRMGIHKNDVPFVLAKNFAVSYQLDDSLRKKLETMIVHHMERLVPGFKDRTMKMRQQQQREEDNDDEHDDMMDDDDDVVINRNGTSSPPSARQPPLLSLQSSKSNTSTSSVTCPASPPPLPPLEFATSSSSSPSPSHLMEPATVTLSTSSSDDSADTIQQNTNAKATPVALRKGSPQKQMKPSPPPPSVGHSTISPPAPQPIVAATTTSSSSSPAVRHQQHNDHRRVMAIHQQHVDEVLPFNDDDDDEFDDEPETNSYLAAFISAQEKEGDITAALNSYVKSQVKGAK
jgi:hypothetical protein